MIYDAELYRHTVVPQIEAWFKDRPDRTPVEQIGLIAIATHCPIIVVAQYLEELYGATTELNALKQVLAKFYHTEGEQ
jgi:hypothetical protein